MRIRFPVKTAGELHQAMNAFDALRDLARSGKASMCKRLTAKLAEKGGATRLWLALYQATEFASVLRDAEIEVYIDDGPPGTAPAG